MGSPQQYLHLTVDIKHTHPNGTAWEQTTHWSRSAEVNPVSEDNNDENTCYNTFHLHWELCFNSKTTNVHVHYYLLLLLSLLTRELIAPNCSDVPLLRLVFYWYVMTYSIQKYVIWNNNLGEGKTLFISLHKLRPELNNCKFRACSLKFLHRLFK